jgi:hypothetical protein
MRNSRGIRRALIALVAIAAMLTIAVASAAPAHFHPNSPASQCDICVTAHVATSQAFAAVQLLIGPQDFGQLVAPTLSSGYYFLKLGPSVGRAPPSL